MKTKICNICKKEKSIKEFYTNKTRYDGLQTKCIECSKIYNKNHYQRNKKIYIQRASKRRQEFKKWWNDFKSQLKCIKCGEAHPSCITFHHRDPTKKEFGISQLTHTFRSKKKVLEEIKKCDVLCFNCHVKLHWKDIEEGRWCNW